MPHILAHPHNHLLAALPADVRQRLGAALKLVHLPQGTVLLEGGQAPSKVYFPAGAIVSLSCQTASGHGAEISQIGNEGLVGIAAFMADDSGPTVAIVQGAGYAYVLSGQRLRDEAGQHPALLSLLLRYTHSLLLQTAQTAVCNRHHSIDQQLCRWLLRFDDYRPGQTLAVTHDQIATRLGVRRENITRAMLKLHKLGAIHCGRSEIRVLDRRPLEQLSCECYGAIRKAGERLLPLTSSPGPLERPAADCRAAAP